MSKKYSGFTLIEVIAAIAIWLSLSMLVLPSFVRMEIERKNKMLKATAQQIMSEEIFWHTDSNVQTKEVVRNGYMYTVDWQEESGHAKVCIRWHDYLDRLVERCGYTKNDKR